MQNYKGACHCKAVTYEVVMELKSAAECNCSHCSLKGFLLAFVPAASVKILSGEEMLTEYRFNKKNIAHLFCKVCGVQVFGRATNADGEPTYAINLRTLEGVDTEHIEVVQYNGKDM